MTEILVVWQYKSSQYDQASGEGGRFAAYVKTFLRLKQQQASSWPSSCTDDTTKERYIDEYEREEGIRLDREKIEKNSGSRSVAKLLKFILGKVWAAFEFKTNGSGQNARGAAETTHDT